MNFDYSERCKDLQTRLLAFMDEHIYPNESRFHQEVLEGKPWSERKKYVWWDEEHGHWTGHDVPDFPTPSRQAHLARFEHPGGAARQSVAEWDVSLLIAWSISLKISPLATPSYSFSISMGRSSIRKTISRRR